MKRNIIKSVTSVGNHAWLFKHLLEENPVLKGVLKGNTKNLSLNQNLEVINCAQQSLGSSYLKQRMEFGLNLSFVSLETVTMMTLQIKHKSRLSSNIFSSCFPLSSIKHNPVFYGSAGLPNLECMFSPLKNVIIVTFHGSGWVILFPIKG